MPGDEELVRGEWRPLRGPSGPLTAGETSPVLTDLGWVKEAVIRLDITEITTPDGDDEVDWYIQTSYNGGVDWADLENVHVATAENGTTEIHLIVIGRPDTTTTSRPETDAGLADVDCSWSDLNAEELVQHGLQMESGARTFVVYDLAGGYELRLTDLVQYPTTDDDAIWEIKKVGGSTIGSGRVEIFVTKRRTA